jgi:hypothetical protein
MLAKMNASKIKKITVATRAEKKEAQQCYRALLGLVFPWPGGDNKQKTKLIPADLTRRLQK